MKLQKAWKSITEGGIFHKSTDKGAAAVGLASAYTFMTHLLFKMKSSRKLLRAKPVHLLLSYLMFGSLLGSFWLLAFKIPFTNAVPVPDEMEPPTKPIEYLMGVVLANDDAHFENSYVSIDVNQLKTALENEINGTRARLEVLKWANSSKAYLVNPPGKVRILYFVE